MPSPDILKVLLVLLPGFVTTGVIRALTVESEKGEFDKVVRALSYSFLNYALFAALRSAKPLTYYLNPNAATLTQPLDIALLGLIALILGCLVAAYKNNDGHAALRSIKVTYRSARSDIWHDCLVVESTQFHVIVTLEDGRRILGWVMRYSDNMENPSLFLRKAAWLVEEAGETKEIPAGNEGILLLPPMKIASVEFLRAAEPESSEEPSDA